VDSAGGRRVGSDGARLCRPQGWRAFWNRGEQPARVLELISPSGFERYFEERAPLLPARIASPPQRLALRSTAARR
jgi:hypothetical protein